MNEAETRAEYVDPKLAESGWGVVDESKIPDPVAAEEHRGALEEFGARRLHLTNSQIYIAIMVTLNFLALVALLVYLM